MFSLLRAVIVTAWREIQTLGSIQGNNFFWACLLLPAGFLWILVGALILIPALTAPFAKIPAIRLKLWPLDDTGRSVLRLLSKPEAESSPWLWTLLPVLELRQILRTLDFWLALLIAVSGTAYRILSPKADPAAFPVLSLLVILALSTLAQNLFGLDGVGGRMRWKMSTVPGWLLLLRKGGVLIFFAVLLTLGLNPVAALTGILAALAIGHHPSVLTPSDSGAWRFSLGQFIPQGFLQVIGMFSCGIAASRGEWFYFGLAAGAYLLSVLVYGWIMERSA